MDDTSGTSAAAVFDALGAQYERAFAGSPAHRDALRELTGALGPHSRVLDVGSGTGRPTAEALVAAGHEVHGVDVSPVMVELAARQVPGASFVRADVRELVLAEESFDAVCVHFSLLQMTRAEQAALLARLALVLRPGGLLSVATVPLDVEGVDGLFMGRPVRVTSFDAPAFTALVTDAGFTVLSERGVLFTPDHPEATPEPHLFLHCRRA
ncbi:class I SAM-dependent methyltransferase [Streptomyces sp. NPDC002690]